MEIISRQWRRGGYSRLSKANRKSMKVVNFGGNTKRAWRIRLTPRLRLKIVSPLKLWYKFKNLYMNMMLRLAANSGTSNSGNIFGVKRIPKAREASIGYSRTEFENRLVLEIYKSISASLELGYNK